MNGRRSVVKCKKRKGILSKLFPIKFSGNYFIRGFGVFTLFWLLLQYVCIWQIIKHKSTSPQMGQSPESVVLIFKSSEEICSFCSFIILFDIPRGLRLTFEFLEFLLRIAWSSSSLKSSLIPKRVVKIAMNGFKVHVF